MCRLPDKLIAVLLSVVLGLIPLRGAVAGVTSTVNQTNEQHLHQMNVNHSSDVVLMDDHATTMGCEICNAHSLCSGSNCVSGHCVSCLLALLPDTLIPRHQISAIIIIQPDIDWGRQPTSSLFRPPRA